MVLDTRTGILIGLVIAVIVVIWLSVPKKKKRSSDRKLKGPEKRIYNQAVRLAPDDPGAAAQLLESISRHREAIDLLEGAGLIDEAANTLLRMGRPNRAALLYKRSGYLKEAAFCFEKAKMPREVAECAREAGDLNLALKYLKIVNDLQGMAECYLDLGNFHKAARLFIKMKQPQKALDLYPTIVQNTTDINLLDFKAEEIELILAKVKTGEFEPSLVEIIIKEGRLVAAITAFLHSGLVEKAADLYTRSSDDIGAQLLGQENYSAEVNLNLANLFNMVSNFEMAGMVFERIEDFNKAGENFAKSENWERALHAFERAGNKEMAIEMRCQLAATGKGSPMSSGRPKSPSPAPMDDSNPFKISSTTVDQPAPAPAPPLGQPASAPEPPRQDFALDEATSILAASSQSSAPPSPPPSPSAGQHQQEFLKINFLEDLDYQQKMDIWKIGKSQNYLPGSIILDFEAEPAGVYFILSGEIACHRKKEGGIQVVDKIQSPATFGEFWLLVDLPSEVRFTAEKECQIHLVERAMFHDLMDRNGTIARTAGLVGQ